MAGKLVAFVFIMLIVFGLGLYVYNSGALNKGISYFKSTIPSSTPSGQSGGGVFGGGTAGNGGTSGSSSISGSSSGGGTIITAAPTSSNPNLENPQMPKGFTAEDLSPYFHEVRLGGLNPGPVPVHGATGYGQITLYASFPDSSTTINVTGWEIKTNRGGEYIPKAINVYDPLGLNAPTDIWLKRGDQLNIYSTSAPVNLRLNECIGYLPNRDQFDPELPQTCPYISNAGLSGFSGACQNYILSLNGCREPDLSSPQIPPYDYECKQYLQDRFNYKWCFDTYFSDPNFLSNQIEVWMGSSPLDRYHDNVELLDGNGLLVDYSSY